ncbi:MAG: GTP 3',8-cyclase MoaA [Elusimicrobia bacterium]|nr:GTP 3',8-cyclase MoaA [Elusimicrobiota bacterium]
MTLIDPFGRAINYLRFSITNRCNLRCAYCLPAQGYRPADNILTDDEILEIAAIFGNLGINKIRLTGGEPLVRPSIVSLIERLAATPEINEVSLSTNGILFAPLARDLKNAGLGRVNISLDSLIPERFAQITRLGDCNAVWRAIDAALDHGLHPVKINVVIMRGINDDEIPKFTRLAYDRPLHVRFIELMPIGDTGFFNRDRHLPLDAIKARCGELEPVNADDQPTGSGPASYFRQDGALGTLGFIGALSCNFCRSCNRLRLTSEGVLQPCLGWDKGINLKDPLRQGANRGQIESLIQECARLKPERHHMDEVIAGAVRESFMCSLGG